MGVFRAGSESSGNALSPAPVLRLAYAGLSDDRTGRLLPEIRLWVFAFPFLVAGLALAATMGGLDLRDGVSQLLAGVALLIGAMLSLFVFLTNLRVKVAESPTYAFRTRLAQLLGGSAAGCLYVALVALVVVGQLILVASVTALRGVLVQPFVAAVVAGTLCHLLAMLLVVVRRLLGTYYELFAADFDPRITAAPARADGEQDIRSEATPSRR